MRNELAEAERRYAEDEKFRALVDAIEIHALAEGYSSHEVMLAALHALRGIDRKRSER